MTINIGNILQWLTCSTGLHKFCCQWRQINWSTVHSLTCQKHCQLYHYFFGFIKSISILARYRYFSKVPPPEIQNCEAAIHQFLNYSNFKFLDVLESLKSLSYLTDSLTSWFLKLTQLSILSFLLCHLLYLIRHL